MSWVNGGSDDPELDRLTGAVRPIAGRVYNRRLYIEAPGIVSQLAAAEAAERQAPVQPDVPAPRHGIGRRVLQWLRGWRRNRA